MTRTRTKRLKTKRSERPGAGHYARPDVLRLIIDPRHTAPEQIGDMHRVRDSSGGLDCVAPNGAPGCGHG